MSANIFENPEVFANMKRIADSLSESNILPAELKKSPANTLAVLMFGYELGIGPMPAINNISIRQGKPVLQSALLRALAQKLPECEYLRCIESTNDVCTFAAKRKGDEEVRLTFTMADAKKAGLTTNAVYQKYPKEMLIARSSGAIVRLVFPGAFAGFYTEGEIMDDKQAASEPTGSKASQIVAAIKPQSKSINEELEAAPNTEAYAEDGTVKKETEKIAAQFANTLKSLADKPTTVSFGKRKGTPFSELSVEDLRTLSETFASKYPTDAAAAAAELESRN